MDVHARAPREDVVHDLPGGRIGAVGVTRHLRVGGPEVRRLGAALAGTVGSTSRDGRAPPRKTRLVAGSGVGHTFGQSALAMASRIRCPAGNTHAVVSISISSS